MLSYIKGTLEEVLEDRIVVDHQGMGYEIKVPGILLSGLPSVGSAVKIYTYLHVREDAIGLFGFRSRDELNTFVLLIGITGIGPKAGLSILSTMTVDQLRFAVLSGDTKAISKTPGIGAKGAQRLIMELKDKMKLEDALHLEDTFMEDPLSGNGAQAEAVLALVSLGYSNSDALRAIQSLGDIKGMTTEALLKASLKKMI